MMNCLPKFLLSTAVSGRAKASVPPPAGKGTTIVTGLFGQLLCASAKGLASTMAPASSALRRVR
jgi:hypothetical protein